MRRILTTKYAGPTETRPSQVLVYMGARRGQAVSWDHALDPVANHEAAALAVLRKTEHADIDWTLVSYELPDACSHSRVVIAVGEEP